MGSSSSERNQTSEFCINRPFLLDIRSAETPQSSACRQIEAGCLFSLHVDHYKWVAGSRKAWPSTNRSRLNILITFGRKTGGWGGVYYARPSLPISIKYKHEGVRIQVKLDCTRKGGFYKYCMAG